MISNNKSYLRTLGYSVFGQNYSCRRFLFKAIDTLDFERLRAEVKSKEAIDERRSDATSVLHYLAGAHPQMGLRLPIGTEPPKNFTKLLISKAPHLIEQKNAYGQTPLHMAARVGYSDVVQQLLNKKANANAFCRKETPLHSACLSTVTFDPFFKIGKLLLKHGADIHARNSSGDTLIFALFNSVEGHLSNSKRSLNPLYNDINRIYHYHLSHLYEKMEWLLINGAKIEDGKRNLLVECLKDLDSYDSGRIKDKSLRPLIPLLIKYSKAVDYKDNEGMNLLHWTALKQCVEGAEQLLESGLHPYEKDNRGITPYDLALFHMNRSLIKSFNPEGDVDHILSNLNPHFFGEMFKKLNNPKKFKSGLPALLSSADLKNPEKRLIELYQLTALPSLTEGRCTPMVEAILKKDLNKVNKLLSQGWNVHVENEFVEDAALKHPGEKIQGFTNSFYKVIHNEKFSLGELVKFALNMDSFWMEALKAMNKRSACGVSFATELDRSLFCIGEEVHEDYVLSLFEHGLTPESYFDETGKSLRDTLVMHYSHSYSDDRGFYAYPNYQGMRKIMEYAYEKGWTPIRIYK